MNILTKNETQLLINTNKNSRIKTLRTSVALVITISVQSNNKKRQYITRTFHFDYQSYFDDIQKPYLTMPNKVGFSIRSNGYRAFPYLTSMLQTTHFLLVLLNEG